MRICIVSWDTEAKQLYKLLHEYHKIECIIERDHTQWGMSIDGVKIVSFSMAYHMFRENLFDVFLIPAMRGINVKTGIFMRLKRAGISSENIWYAPLRMFKDLTLSDEYKRKMLCRFEERKELDFLALHISDHCNLNCAYCSVFCGMKKTASFPNEISTFEGLNLLRKYFDQVLVFRVLGGEPLLNPKWLNYCLKIRELYPLADIEVVTNGLLLLKVTNDELEMMRKNNIAFDISYYPVIGEKIDEIHERLDIACVKHYITQENEYFSRLYNFEHQGNAEYNYSVCKMKFMCLNMYEKYLCVCHALIGFERAKQFISPKDADSMNLYRIDLSDQDLSVKIIQERLDQAMPICRYCNQELAQWHPISQNEDVFNLANWSLV